MIEARQLFQMLERIPSGSGNIVKRHPISPFDFRTTAGLILTGSGNTQIAVASGVATVTHAASTAADSMVSIPLPGDYDDSDRSASISYLQGDNAKLVVLASQATNARTLTAAVKVTRDAALAAAPTITSIVKTIASGADKVAVEFDFSGNKLLPDDILHFTLTSENTTGLTTIHGAWLEYRSMISQASPNRR
jgi:hypothetical protein